jgi:hypothetical protein
MELDAAGLRGVGLGGAVRALSLGMLVAAALLLAACGEPIPQARLAYAGDWRSKEMRLVITPGGYCEYSRRKEGGNSTEINAPIQRFEGDNFVVGIGLFTTTFMVSKPPHLEGGQWKMTVDGVELTRVTAADEVRA